MKRPKTLDEQLTEHLKQAEHHLIEAVKLVQGQSTPLRMGRYCERLLRAQETITSLHAEELVRVRGMIGRGGRRK